MYYSKTIFENNEISIKTKCTKLKRGEKHGINSLFSSSLIPRDFQYMYIYIYIRITQMGYIIKKIITHSNLNEKLRSIYQNPSFRRAVSNGTSFRS